jgi:hypothetical protein
VERSDKAHMAAHVASARAGRALGRARRPGRGRPDGDVVDVHVTGSAQTHGADALSCS